MKLLFISQFDHSSRAVSTILNYAKIAASLGHEVAVFGEENSEFPIEFTLSPKRFDFALFVVYDTTDFPDLPYLARLLDGVSKDRRVVIDCTGRYNDTIRIDHDFNHLEKLDGHQGWEWVEGIEAVADLILQPTTSPRRSNVRQFLFHGFNESAI